MRTFAIVNQKGGCGKTTTAINLAAVYARRGLRTLLVDMDPQSHCAAGLGVPEEHIDMSIGDALVANLDDTFDRSSLLWPVSRGLHLAPSTMMLSALEAPGGGLHALPDRDRRLAALLTLLDDDYDCCLIDCPPSIGLLTFNALRAATEALVPVETGYFSLRGARRQRKTIAALIARIGGDIPCHILPSMHRPSPLARKILECLRESFGDEVAPVVIREHETLREAVSYGQPVVEFAPGSEADLDFEALATWLEECGRKITPTVEVPPQAAGSRAAELARRVSRDGPLQFQAPVPTQAAPPLAMESDVPATPSPPVIARIAPPPLEEGPRDGRH